MNRSSCLSKGGWVAFNVVLYLKSSLVRLSFGRNARTILEKWRHFGRRTILTMRATPPAHLPRSRRVAGSVAASQVVIRLKTEQIRWEMKIPASQVDSSVSDFRELKKAPRLQGQRKKKNKKNNWLYEQNNITLFGTFPWSPLDCYDVASPNVTFYGGVENTTNNFLLSFWT